LELIESNYWLNKDKISKQLDKLEEFRAAFLLLESALIDYNKNFFEKSFKKLVDSNNSFISLSSSSSASIMLICTKEIISLYNKNIF